VAFKMPKNPDISTFWCKWVWNLRKRKSIKWCMQWI